MPSLACVLCPYRLAISIEQATYSASSLMLRFLALTLVLINLVYLGWSQGLLPGLAPEQQTEPQRIGQQLRPDALRLLTVPELRAPEATPAAASKQTECLQAGLFDEAQSALLRPALASTLPPGSWTLDSVVEPARWIVYMGRYASAELLAKKRAELAALNLRYEPLVDPALQLGLSLGGFETQAAATAALGSLSRRGVRSARVLQERAELRGVMLRLPDADAALRTRLDALKPVLADKLMGPCQ